MKRLPPGITRAGDAIDEQWLNEMAARLAPLLVEDARKRQQEDVRRPHHAAPPLPPTHSKRDLFFAELDREAHARKYPNETLEQSAQRYLAERATQRRTSDESAPKRAPLSRHDSQIPPWIRDAPHSLR